MSRGPTWTDMEVEILRRAAQHGIATKIVALLLGRSRIATTAAFRQFGFTKRRERADQDRDAAVITMRNNGDVFADIGEALGVSTSRAQALYNQAVARRSKIKFIVRPQMDRDQQE